MKPIVAFSLSTAVTLLASGCETTGDPRQGALFGWSEAKAQDRQAILRQQLQGAYADNQSASARGASLRATQSSLRSDVSARSARLSALEGRVAALQRDAAAGRTSPVEIRRQASQIESQISSQDAADPQMQELLGRVKDLAR